MSNWMNLPSDISALTTGEPLDLGSQTGLVVVLPHPDDETFAAGGTIALMADAGIPVTYVCGTWGDGGRRMGRPIQTTREGMRDIRQQELTEACAVLGCDFINLGLRDKTVEFEDPEEVAGRIREVLERLRPSTVITFYPGHGVHPDHDALGAHTRLAVQGMDSPAPQLLAVAVGDRAQLTEELGEPHVHIDIRSVAQRKVDALRAHRSQTLAMFQHLDEPESETDAQAQAFRNESLAVERYYVLEAAR